MTEALHSGKTILSGATTNTTSSTLDLGGRQRELTVYLKWATSFVAGNVIFETADDESYAGTWASLGPSATVAFSGTAPKQDVVIITGVLKAVRCRTTNTDAGGGAGVTVTVYSN